MNDIELSIKTRYEAEAGESMGCANLWPWLNVEVGSHWCDLGCGKGAFTAQMAKKIGSRGRVTGVDMTSALIDIAKTRYPEPYLTWVVSDITSLPLESVSQDGVTSNCVINHIIDKRAVFCEIARVLKAGGVFVVADVMSVQPLPDSVRNDPVAIAACWGGAIPRSDYLAIVESVGFKDICIVSSRRYIKEGYELESIILKGVRR